jgi:hypothetical protein
MTFMDNGVVVAFSQVAGLGRVVSSCEISTLQVAQRWKGGAQVIEEHKNEVSILFRN